MPWWLRARRRTASCSPWPGRRQAARDPGQGIHPATRRPYVSTLAVRPRVAAGRTALLPTVWMILARVGELWGAEPASCLLHLSGDQPLFLPAGAARDWLRHVCLSADGFGDHRPMCSMKMDRAAKILAPAGLPSVPCTILCSRLPLEKGRSHSRSNCRRTRRATAHHAPKPLGGGGHPPLHAKSGALRPDKRGSGAAATGYYLLRHRIASTESPDRRVISLAQGLSDG